MSAGLPDIGHVATSQVDGLAIRLARGGRSDGVPLLLTSPWPESIYAFRAIWPEIEALGPVIAVDLPGFGRSEGRADLMSPEAMGDFVIKLAQHFGDRRMDRRDRTVVGHDQLFQGVGASAFFSSTSSLFAKIECRCRAPRSSHARAIGMLISGLLANNSRCMSTGTCVRFVEPFTLKTADNQQSMKTGCILSPINNPSFANL